MVVTQLRALKLQAEIQARAIGREFIRKAQREKQRLPMERPSRKQGLNALPNCPNGPGLSQTADLLLQRQGLRMDNGPAQAFT
jgi:hypothetical protein